MMSVVNTNNLLNNNTNATKTNNDNSNKIPSSSSSSLASSSSSSSSLSSSTIDGFKYTSFVKKRKESLNTNCSDNHNAVKNNGTNATTSQNKKNNNQDNEANNDVSTYFSNKQPQIIDDINSTDESDNTNSSNNNKSKKRTVCSDLNLNQFDSNDVQLISSTTNNSINKSELISKRTKYTKSDDISTQTISENCNAESQTDVSSINVESRKEESLKVLNEIFSVFENDISNCVNSFSLKLNRLCIQNTSQSINNYNNKKTKNKINNNFNKYLNNVNRVKSIIKNNNNNNNNKSVNGNNNNNADNTTNNDNNTSAITTTITITTGETSSTNNNKTLIDNNNKQLNELNITNGDNISNNEDFKKSIDVKTAEDQLSTKNNLNEKNSINNQHPAPFPKTNSNSSEHLPPTPTLSIETEKRAFGTAVILTWEIPSYDQNMHKKIKEYELYGYRENDIQTISGDAWKLIGTIPSYTPPVKCTLTDFMESSNYHFIIRVRDYDNRFSNFSEPASIKL